MKLFFRKYGDGPPLIILHGLYGSSDNWVTIAGKISSHFTVYLPDLRNHGNSPHSDIHNYDSLSDDIIEFAQDQKLTKFFLAGHSMGGKAAAAFALKKPELLSGLIIIDIPVFPDSESSGRAMNEHLEILQAILSADLQGTKKRDDIDAVLAVKIHSPAVRALIMKNLQRIPEGSFRWKINAGTLLKNLGEITGGLPAGYTGTDQVTGFPVIVLKGEHSDYVSEKGFREITKLFPGAELRIIKKAGHWVHADNPEAVIKEFLDLLNH